MRIRYPGRMIEFRWTALVAFLAASGSLLADSDDWGRVKALPTGENVTVIQSDMKSVRGTLRATSDEEIVVASGVADVTIPRVRVVRISRHRARNRVTNAVVLGVAGGLIGAGAMRFGIACAETNDGCRNTALAAIGGAAGGAAIGALALPDTAEVYRIRKK